jgi:geranylgeranylglycerol-phosphate geranylgeranyltransferase
MITGLLKILRPVNGLISLLTVWISYIIAGGGYGDFRGLSAGAAAFFFAGFANSVNDIADVEIDRINKPSRPLPAGAISVKAAVYESIAVGVIALLFSIYLGFGNVVIALIALPGMLLYNLRLKRTVLLGNITVSMIASLAFLYGGAAYENIGPTVFPAVLAFLLHLGREVIKDIEDARGDSMAGARTLPVARGMRFSRLTAAIILVILLVTTFIPFLMDLYGFRYLIVVAVVDAIVLYIILQQLFAKRCSDKLHSLLLKVAMPIGILSVYLGTCFP